MNGDTKKRHAKATEEASQFKNKDGSIDPEIQAIYARMYGLFINNEKVIIYCYFSGFKYYDKSNGHACNAYLLSASKGAMR